MGYRWMPLYGEFQVADDQIVFRGRQLASPTTGEPQPQQQPMASVGIVLCDQLVANGKLSADIRFASVTTNSVCELIIGYDLNTKGQLSAGLGGSWAMFSIREWLPVTTPGQQSGSWSNYELTGDRVNLKPDTVYAVEVQVEGSNVSLRVDGVQVGSATLTSAPNQPRQAGIFCISESDVTVEHFRVDSERPLGPAAGSQLPFDVSAFRVLFYDDSIGGKQT